MTENERAPGEGFLVLWAGGLEIAERDAQVELRRSGVRVEVTDGEELSSRANARAPDLVVLGGELGEEPELHAAALAEASPSAAVPIVALAPHHAAAPRPRARFGVIARFDRELDPPALAAHILTLLNGLATRAPVWRVSLKSGALAPLASRFAASGRAGLLALAGSGAIAVQARGGIAPEKLEVPASLTDALFHERPLGRVRVLRARPHGEATAPSLEGVRVLVVDDEAERRDTITKKLEQTGAQVRGTGLVAQAIHASRALDPTVIVIAAPALRSSAVAPLWNEPRLVPAALLVLDGDALARPDSAALLAEVSSLARHETTLARRLRDREALAERLETLGPARWLKLLGRCEHEVTLRVFTAAGRVRVDLAGGRIQGASFYPLGTDEIIDGRAAVDALMGFPFGRVLAGPPGAVAALEGVSAKRRASVVGKLEPAAPGNVRRKRGLVAEEVVVKRTDATQRPIAPPKRIVAPAGSLVAVGDTDDDDATSAYSSETMEELRAAIRTSDARVASDAPTAPPPGRAAGEKVKAPALEAIEPDEPIAATETIERADEEEPARTRAPAVIEPIAPEREVPARAVAARPRRGGNGVWFAAGIALALGVGGWAAWRLHGEDAARSTRSPRRDDPAVERAPGDDPASATDTPTIAEASPEPVAEPTVAEPSAAPEPTEEAAEATTDETVDETASAATADSTDAPEAAADEAEDAPAEAEPAASGESAPLLVMQALEAARQNDYPRSEALSRRALELAPENSRAGYRLAVALFHEERWEEALATAREVASWDAHDPLPRALMGDIYSRRGRFIQAARAYRSALEADPSFEGAARSLERLHARGIDP